MPTALPPSTLLLPVVHYLGVVIGIINGGDMGAMNTVTRDLPVYHPASTAQYLAVCDDPNILLMIQDDASTQATAPNLWAGKNANLVAGGRFDRDRLLGLSARGVHGCHTNTLDLKIIRPLRAARQHHRHCCEYQHERQMAGQAQ
jgi:hypothetical protein